MGLASLTVNEYQLAQLAQVECLEPDKLPRQLGDRPGEFAVKGIRFSVEVRILDLSLGSRDRRFPQFGFAFEILSFD